MTTNTLDRRQLITRTGAVAALSALWTAQSSAQGEIDAESRRAGTVIDVACLGNTFRAFFPDGSTPPPDFGGTDSRGGSFSVEGLIYRAGTIDEASGFDPFSAPAIGHWFCRGWFIAHLERPLPHVITTQEYLFGLITADNLSPADTLVSSGVEGGFALAHRAVIGGSGRYRHAHGDVRQLTVGTNITDLLPGVPAPTFRFTFRP